MARLSLVSARLAPRLTLLLQPFMSVTFLSVLRLQAVRRAHRSLPRLLLPARSTLWALLLSLILLFLVVRPAPFSQQPPFRSLRTVRAPPASAVLQLRLPPSREAATISAGRV